MKGISKPLPPNLFCKRNYSVDEASQLMDEKIKAYCLSKSSGETLIEKRLREETQKFHHSRLISSNEVCNVLRF